MKDQYTKPSSGFSSMFTFIGFMACLVLTIGLLDKTGVKISMAGDKLTVLNASAETSGDVLTSDENTIIISPDKGSRAKDSKYTFDGTGNYDLSTSSSSKKSSSQASARQRDIEHWIERFAAIAMEEAGDKGIPAGVALAVGITELKEGKRIDSRKDFLQYVIAPLQRAKAAAAEQGQGRYFKYSANSDRWTEGLNHTGTYAAATLRNYLRQYDLAGYDEVVKGKITGRAAADITSERKAGYVANEVTTRMSRAADRGSDLPTGSKSTNSSNRAVYDELVGKEVAREVARKKIKSSKYLSEEEMDRIVEETDKETASALKRSLALPGRKINRKHKEAEKHLDITNPKNTQAREELYQRKLREKRERS